MEIFIGAKLKVTLLTGCDRAFSPVLEPTLPGKTEYCKRHGLHFVNRAYHAGARGTREYWRRHISGKNPARTLAAWGDREKLMLEELYKAEWLWFLDADTLIMNHRIDIRTIIDSAFDCVIGVDVNGINNGSFLLRSGPIARQFLQDVLDLRHECPNDQVAMSAVMAKTPEFRVKYVSQRAFNSYLEVEYGRPDDDRYAYREGDLVLHLPGLSNARRIELIQRYLSRVIV